MKKINKILQIKALRGNMTTTYMCPHCREIINYDNYCSKCGAKLKEK